MSMLTIRNLDPALKERLRVQAARHGRSMEAEARAILADAVASPPLPARNLYERIRARFAPLGGADDLVLPPRLPDRAPPSFG
jgi:hypothetical protein